MKAHEIYAAVAHETVKEMLDWFRAQDRKVYRTAIAALAGPRKLRPVFIEKKPMPDQYLWLHKTLAQKQSNSVGEQLLQGWLMGGQQEMLAAFCDAVGIEHDGKGTVSGDIPESFDADKLKAAVDALLTKHSPALVSIYLHCFNLQREDGWPEITAVIAGDDRLKLG
ncbi:MAG TPA: hypothetical protein VFY13_07945 [Luteolibacter sp.]|nr:hypothetical protein [Luteolibacter sp.]